MRYIITNDFHNTQATFYAKPGDVLSLRRIRSIRSKLCGMKDCICGGTLGERGKQTFDYDVDIDRFGVSSVKILD